MNFKRIKTLYRKEILDVFRDKKSVIMMFAVPLLIYPLVFMGSIFVMSMVQTDKETKEYKVAFSEGCEGLEDYFENEYFQNMDEKTRENAGYSFNIVELKGSEDSVYNDALAKGQIDAFVSINKNNEDDEDSIYKERFMISYLSGRTDSSYAADYVKLVIDDYSVECIKDFLSGEGYDPETVLNPVSMSFSDLSPKEETVGNLLSYIIPFMLVVSLLMGTMYPAIDATAGEKERGTLETVFTLPITNSELITSKFLTVGTIGVISAILNVASMGFTGIYMYKVMLASVNVGSSMRLARFVPAIVISVFAVLAFAIFISAVQMCVCAMTSSYKEANNALTPVILVVMFASFASFIPAITLTTKTAIIPVVNISLLLKNILLFNFNFKLIFYVLGTNVCYGVLAIVLLGKIYSSEKVLFGDKARVSEIFEKRKNIQKGGTPTRSDAWLVIALTFVLIIYGGTAMELRYGIGGVVATQLFLLFVPVLVALYTKKSFKDTFSLRLANPKYFVAGLFIIVGGLSLGILLTAFASMIFGAEVATDDGGLLGDKFWLTLFVVAVLPAICEEMLFRGYLLSAFRRNQKAIVALVTVAVIFGIYHMSPVRFFTTGFLGFLMCYMCYKSGSILPGMLMHFLNNGLAVYQTYYPENLAKIIPILNKEELAVTDGILLFVVGIIALVVGLLITRDKTQRIQN